jgi:hypothetical protein
VPVVNWVKRNPQDLFRRTIRACVNSSVRDKIATFQRTYDTLIDLWPVCGDGDAGQLCLGSTEPVVHSRVCLRLSPGLGVRIYAGSMAIWNSRGCLVRGRTAALDSVAHKMNESS